MPSRKKPLFQRIMDRALGNGLINFIARVAVQMGRTNGAGVAASIAYYGFLSIFPLLLAIVGMLGFILPSEDIQQQITAFAQENFPGIADIVTANIQHVINARGALSIIGLIGFLWAGSGIFGALDIAINRTRGITRLAPFYIRRPRDIGLTIGLGILFLLSMGASYVFSFLNLSSLPVIGAYAVEIGSRIVAFLISFVIFLLLFKIMPNTRTYWRYIWFGAFVTAVLFEIGRSLFVYYINNFVDYTLVYGAIGSIIAILVLIYYLAIVLIIGVIITAEYGRMRRGETSANYLLYPPDITAGSSVS